MIIKGENTMKKLLLILFLLGGGLLAQNTDKPSMASKSDSKILHEEHSETLDAKRIIIINSSGTVVYPLDSLVVIQTDIWDAATSTNKITVLNLDKYEAIAHTVDTTNSTITADHYHAINMDGYRNLDISVISTDATGMDIKVFRAYDSSLSEADTAGWYNCTNDFFESGATLTLTGSAQAKDGTSPEMMPLKYLIWYQAGNATNSLDIFSRKHTKR